MSNALIWSNMLLLFALSLVPFSTSYLGEHHFSRDATLLYLATMLLPSLTYIRLHQTIRGTGRQSATAATYYRQASRKGVFAILVYLTGVVLTLVALPWLGIACAAVIALFWLLPRSPIDRLFGADARG